VPRRLTPLDGSSHLDRASEQQQLFRQGGLPGIRVGDDGKGASFADFSVNYVGKNGVSSGICE
jgi:hypothetical protein